MSKRGETGDLYNRWSSSCKSEKTRKNERLGNSTTQSILRRQINDPIKNG